MGQFDNVAGANLPLSPLTLFYAENGRGKTTLAAVLRSLATGDHALINERHRLGSPNLPHIIIQLHGGAPAIFANGAWSQTLGDIAVFDDRFVSDNVYAGMRVDAEHRQNLHDLIIGAQGVALNEALQLEVRAIERHNATLAGLAEAMPAATRGSLTVDQFCALQARPDLEQAILQAEQQVAAARAADEVARQPGFEALSLPRFDLDALAHVLSLGLPDVEQDATARVAAHLNELGRGGEAWVADGLQRIVHPTSDDASCPFCAVPLSHSQLIAHYQAYFSEAYRALKSVIADATRQVGLAHSGDAKASFERSLRVASERRAFWARFTEVPDITTDSAAVVRLWNAAYIAVEGLLRQKSEAPLEAVSITADVRSAVDAFHACGADLQALNAALAARAEAILLVKEGAAGANLHVLERDLADLVRARQRFSPAMVASVAAYLAEKTAKAVSEGRRNAARDALTTYRDQVFPNYQQAINDYLGRFNAGFRLSGVESVNIRGGSTTSYNMLVNNVVVPLVPANDGDPGFHTALSAGDRNTLALAFFFASLDADPRRAQKIVVIDDPMTSLDEHRSLRTVTEIRQLLQPRTIGQTTIPAVAQVIVLSHSKPFLCDVWNATERMNPAAIKLVRAADGTAFATWDVSRDIVTEHDVRHALISRYVSSSIGVDERSVAAALRPTLEAFLRVAYPAQFPPGHLIGPFLDAARRARAAGNPFMSQADVQELEQIKDYGNLFHHDSNPASYQTQVINDQQLVDFANRTLAFARRH